MKPETSDNRASERYKIAMMKLISTGELQLKQFLCQMRLKTISLPKILKAIIRPNTFNLLNTQFKYPLDQVKDHNDP